MDEPYDHVYRLVMRRTPTYMESSYLKLVPFLRRGDDKRTFVQIRKIGQGNLRTLNLPGGYFVAIDVPL